MSNGHTGGLEGSVCRFCQQSSVASQILWVVRDSCVLFFGLILAFFPPIVAAIYLLRSVSHFNALINSVISNLLAGKIGNRHSSRLSEPNRIEKSFDSQ